MIEPFLRGDPRKISPLLFAQSVANAPAGAVARLLRVRGQNLTTMGGGALFLAIQTLRRGEAAALLVGGFETIQPDYVLADEQLGRIRPRGQADESAPSTVAGVGITSGEGAVLVALELAEQAQERGVTTLAVILGAATAFDPDGPPGPGVLSDCAAEALADARVRAGDVDAVVAGGDGLHHDGRTLAEALARVGVRGTEAENLRSLLGETLGMATSASIAWAATSTGSTTLVLDATRNGNAFAAVVARAATRPTSTDSFPP
jgi:3-oxoacyl-(acyl-carrier-protein) synthase